MAHFANIVQVHRRHVLGFLLIALSLIAVESQDFDQARREELAALHVPDNKIGETSNAERRFSRYDDLQILPTSLRYQKSNSKNCGNSVECDSNNERPIRPKVTYHDAYRIRAKQCTAFDKQTYNGKYINWKPYMKDHLNLCRLYCLAAGHKFYARLRNTVEDGTPCGKDYSKVCIRGNCQRRPPGCRSLEGPCKVEKRRKIVGVFNSTKLEIGYNFVATIPKGATDISVEELARSRSYLALKDHTSSTYYLNGHWMISLSKTIRSAGTEIHYKRDGNTPRGGETIKADGPLEKNLDVMMIYQGDRSTILYSFFVTEKEYQRLKKQPVQDGQNLFFRDVPKNFNGRKDVGKEKRRRTQFSPSNKNADFSTAGRDLPPPGHNAGRPDFGFAQRPQNPAAHRGKNNKNGQQQSPSWYGSSWVQFGGVQGNAKQTPVSKSDSGRRSVLNQQVFRPDANKFQYRGGKFGNPYTQNSRIPGYQSGQWGNPVYRKPNNKKQFYTSDQEGTGRRTLEGYIWRTSGFTPCSASCAGGIQSGVVHCIRSNTGETVLDIKCDPKLRPPERRRVCNLHPCPPSWVPQEWKECSKTCGEGEELRDLMCKQVIDRNGEKVTAMLPIIRCPMHLRPEVVRKCFLGPCPTQPKPRWVAGNWGKCSVECGHGLQKRVVTCKNFQNETVNEFECGPRRKPSPLKSCYLGLCKAAWYTGAYWSQCTKSCGSGIQSRPVICARVDGSALNELQCRGKEKPQGIQACNKRHCRGVWMASEWSKCSTDCGSGIQERVVICMRYISGKFQETYDNHCASEDKPAVRKDCKTEKCKPSWFTTPWTKCSVSCGRGVMTRSVSCLDDAGKKVGGCKAWERPQRRRTCHMKSCPGEERKAATQPESFCEDKNPPRRPKFCWIVKSIRFCRIPSYRKRCCKSCSSA